MTGIQLLESLQELEDELLLDSEETKRPRGTWLRWGALAACAALLAGSLYLGLGGKPTETAVPGETAGGAETGAPMGSAGSGEAAAPTDLPAVPGGNVPPPPGRDTAPDPDPLSWNDVSEIPAADAVGGVIMVGEALTPEQVSACAPAIRLEWMEGFTGAAAYYLHDGSGGLAYVELELVNRSRQGGDRIYRILLRDAEDPYARSWMPETELREPMIDYHPYNAFRCQYTDGGEERSSLTSAYVYEGIAYVLSTDVPRDQEKYAGKDMLDLMLCYFGTKAPPDLSSFRYGGGEEGDIP